MSPAPYRVTLFVWTSKTAVQGPCDAVPAMQRVPEEPGLEEGLGCSEGRCCVPGSASGDPITQPPASGNPTVSVLLPRIKAQGSRGGAAFSLQPSCVLGSLF